MERPQPPEWNVVKIPMFCAAEVGHSPVYSRKISMLRAHHPLFYALVVVRVLNEGFEYDGRRFASLSAITGEIDAR
jgi:hypothetical protein